MEEENKTHGDNRTRIEDELHNSESRYRTLFDNSPASITLVDMNGIIIDCNEATKKLIGYSKEEIIGKPFEELLTLKEEDLPKLRERFGMLSKGESDSPYELEIIRKDGQKHWIRVLNSLLFKECDIVGIQVISEDITDEKKAEEALRQSESLLSGVFNAIEGSIVVLDRDLNVIHHNYMMKEWVGRSFIGEKCYSAIWGRTTACDGCQTLKVFKDGETHIREVSPPLEGRPQSHFHVSSTPMKGENGEIVGAVEYAIDITDRKMVEEALKESEEKFRNLSEQSPNMIFINQMGRVVYANMKCEEVLGYTREEFYAPDFDFLTLIAPEFREALRRNFKMHKEGREVPPIEYGLMTKQGKRLDTILTTKLIKYEGENAILGIVTDITEHKKAEEALQASEEKHRTLFETMTQGVVYQDVDGNIISANSAAEQILGLTMDQMIGRSSMDPSWKSVHEDGSDFPGEAHPSMVALETGEEVRNVVMGVFQPDKERHVWININAVPQFRNGENEPYQVYTTFEDITDRIETEEHIKASLHEKELLLKEIHHRVKNNLQVISSMLSLQSMHIMDDDLKAMFRESQGRVQTMAIVHEKMYQSADLSKIGFADYIKDLTNELFASYGVDSSQITSEVNVEDIKLGVDVAIPCGLIVNELISNSLKHAFPNGEKGEITINLNKGDDNKFKLIVSDNGVGFPKGIDFKEMESLGLRLVNTLVDQLKGTIELENKDGTKFKIKFTGPEKLKGLRD